MRKVHLSKRRKLTNLDRFNKVIMPVNDSSLPVQNYAAMIAREFNSKVIIIRITSIGIEGIEKEEDLGKETIERIRSYLNQKYEKMLGKTVNQFERQGIDASAHLFEHIDPADHILVTTREEEGDLIIMGHKEESKEGTYTLGSTTRKVYRHSTKPVLIVKEVRKPKKILVGFDSSEEAQEALKYAEEIASKFDSRIKILHVTPRPQFSPSKASKEEVLDDFKSLGEKIIEKANLQYNPEKVEKEVRIGKPAEVILEEAEKGDFDLIAIGSRGLTTVKEYLIGSVSEKVSEYAKVPVLVAKKQSGKNKS